MTCNGFVLVVDDEDDTRELYRELLEARGYQVATAADGVEALEVMRSGESICLVLLDLLMPNMDGFEVLRHLSTDPRWRDLVVWVSTSSPERVPAGVPCLPKPVDVGRLLFLVAEHCATNAALRGASGT